MILVSCHEAHKIDERAMVEWCLSSSVLVEAAGRECANSLIAVWSQIVPETVKTSTRSLSIILVAGSGNNAADGMVLLKTLILKGFCNILRCKVILAKPIADSEMNATANPTPRSQVFKILQKMGIPCLLWQDLSEKERYTVFSKADLIIDALTGTGLSGPVHGAVAELIAVINKIRNMNTSQRIIAIDIPSGLSDSWEIEYPLIAADLTLAIEPVKACLYKPQARMKAGHIIPVTGIFPEALLTQIAQNTLITFSTLASDQNAREALSVQKDAYKHKRGVVQIFAGALGTSGAAMLASRGAQAGGAGLVQLVTEQLLAEQLMAQAGGLLVTCQLWLNEQKEQGMRSALTPDAIVMGPGLVWNNEKEVQLQKAIHYQIQQHCGLVFDADAIVHAAVYTFTGPTVFTPHPVEFERLINVLPHDTYESNIPSDDELRRMIATNPVPLLQRAARQINAVILLKGHVIYISAPDGSYSVIDGMESMLAMGGSGDLLAGLIGALMARMRRNRITIDPVLCSQWAVTILLEAGHRLAHTKGFQDPLTLAEMIGTVAGELWLPR
ncbi:NAD(P)H-hydrate dehydratase [Gracilinema caldarium]|uniref:ADP-dependent (S)-NAD(P)H-hydrate dehydratase n=1 Tax=Gracilinema caldarium (strain ATCC 51460 / DSM 7334 / H1) TaxID=744872 RepID=F8EXK5_GRAC1|nr:NAD(P)H-hydrate dehydratase [Gracilinema caldarium]AEJ19586.1 YjeF-related protein [Gracilinema caldarium DSM 7334]